MIAQVITNPVIPVTDTATSLLQRLIPLAIEWALIIGAVIFFFMLLFGAIKWISSGGDKGKIESARENITSAIVGLIILFATFAIIGLIGTFFKINLLNITLPTITSSGSYCSSAETEFCSSSQPPVFLHCIPDATGGHCGT